MTSVLLAEGGAEGADQPGRAVCNRTDGTEGGVNQEDPAAHDAVGAELVDDFANVKSLMPRLVRAGTSSLT